MIHTGSVSGHFDLRVYDANTGRLTKSRSFPNLITNQGLVGLCSGTPDFSFPSVCVGDGTNAPAVTDTQLGHTLAASDTPLNFAAGNGNYGAPDYISYVRGVTRFSAGRFDGTAISEIGVCNLDQNIPVFSRALILDQDGNPSTLVVLSNEYLDVTYTLFYHPDLTDTQFSFTMGGVTYNCIARASLVGIPAFSPRSPIARNILSVYLTTNSQTLGDVTGVPIYESGGAVDYQGSNGEAVSYSTATPYTYRSKVTFGLVAANFDGGIGSITVGRNGWQDWGMYTFTQISFTPKLPKDENTEIVLTFAKTVSRYVAPTP